MLPYSENLVQSKGNWRAITYDWNVLSSYSMTNAKMYCLTDFQANWLLSNVPYLSWITRQDNSNLSASELAQLASDMEYALMSCYDVNGYQIQTIFNNQQNALLSDYSALWNGVDPSSVNPDAPDDFFNGDGSSDRNDALCTALTLWTYSYAVEWVTSASIILGIASAVSSLVDFLIPVGGNIAVKVIAGLTAPLQSQVDAMLNQAALDKVICDWLDELTGTAISASNWTNTVQGLSYTVNSDLWHIQQLLAADTQVLVNFLSFVNSLGEGYELAQLGAFVCACNDDEWEYTIDFKTNQGTLDGWYHQIWGDGWVSGKGWQSEFFGTAPNQQNLNRVQNDLIASANLTYIEFTIENLDGTATSYGTDVNSRVVSTILYLNAVQQYRENYFTSGQPIISPMNQFDDPSAVVADKIEIVWNPTLVSPNLLYLTGLTIRGFGFNPFS